MYEYVFYFAAVFFESTNAGCLGDSLSVCDWLEMNGRRLITFESVKVSSYAVCTRWVVWGKVAKNRVVPGSSY